MWRHAFWLKDTDVSEKSTYKTKRRQNHIFHIHGFEFQISQVLGYVPE